MDRQKSRATRRNIFAVAIGNASKWCDFAVYGFFAPTLGRLFFPTDDAVASLLAAFDAFAIGYAARPVGGAIFGHPGDHFGRATYLALR